MIQFKVKQLTPGRPGPGTAVAVVTRTITPTGESDGWHLINYCTSNEARGGHEQANKLATALQDVWDRYLAGTL